MRAKRTGALAGAAGHPAKLNFGDCFAYALATDLDEPLLFIGQDFIHTDFVASSTDPTAIVSPLRSATAAAI